MHIEMKSKQAFIEWIIFYFSFVFMGSEMVEWEGSTAL